ncbi:TolC family protein [Flavobacterium cerinum]|uniref:TolC family protein n=1 Tax=Flavobacterium cerinum TaxID=2502784 RepID=A0ABY5IWC5_9FLAO|nr:TolC family protein [Flavobacterium cerinum]UUC45756.1 TolC family protein [Flavobacterium cerinum]
MKHYLLIILAIVTSNLANAQEVLTAKEAVEIALKNNYDILIAANQAKISEKNAGVANAGMLPTLGATLTKNNNTQNSTQTQADGSQRELNNAKNNSLNYGVALGWTIFDGLGMFARYDQLKELEKQGQTQLKSAIVTKVADVLSAYYNLVQQQQMLTTLDTAVVISKQRLQTADNRFKIGKASKLEVLNAQVDLNTDTTNLIKQKELYANAVTALNELLVRDVTTPCRVEETVSVDHKLILKDLMTLAEKQNPDVQLAIINKRVAELDLKQVKANRYPVVRLNSGYNFSETESSLGFVTQSSSKGFNYGLTATLNIFNGFLQHRNEKVANLQVENTQFLLDKQKQSLNTQLATVYQSYQTNLELKELEAKNEDIARQNLDITLEKFRIGTITTIEFRNAQLNYITARTRHNAARFQAKISEVALKELAGTVTF